ncbi:4-(cytidine 5'-diphospho)-2-C-methyl-D-erythritol kinase [Alphaproteobacteria bacterium 46_93_T64]|nr:4-(cytidine 5'-diphospho)-2-C-methyl-D-erythritol kinase [Alphaproteobacteria bacterium 46_93_T64]
MSLSKLARPKINLFLHITGKRADGYHLLESLVCFPEGGDKIRVQSEDQIIVSVSGPFANMLGPSQDNLVVLAAKLLQEQQNINMGAHIYLEKNLPVASGIGGGSSNAAICLQLLCELWKVTPSNEELKSIGEQIGADVPVCLYGRSALMKGIGEIIEPVSSLPDLYILLVNPLISVSTPSVFKTLNWDNKRNMFLPFGFSTDVDEFLGELENCTNDLQTPAISLVPEISSVLSAIDAQEGCRLSRMSGSGATCFGLFKTRELAERARVAILESHPDWWGVASRMNTGAAE